MHFPDGMQQIGTFNKTDATWAYTGTSTDLSEGGNGFLTLVHEFGHGLGLDHPHDGTKFTKLPGVTSALGDLGDNNINQTIYTAMSYNSDFNDPRAGESDAVNWGYVMGPSAIDIAVVQRLYGARESNTGDTTYDLVSANTTGTGYATIWDTGGIDTINGAGDIRAFIDLRAATLLETKGGGGWASFKQDIAGGFTIANSVVIENATGGDKNDILIGNSAANELQGGGGKDVLKGNGGNDILRGGAKKDVLSGGKGDDTLDGGRYQDADAGRRRGRQVVRWSGQ
jgi:serralysin